jgi:hypothetical protein
LKIQADIFSENVTFFYYTCFSLLQLLHGEPARVARDWVRDARVHLETRQAAELLLAHAAATSMRTVY